jgi:gliding motility-associated-like protein
MKKLAFLLFLISAFSSISFQSSAQEKNRMFNISQNLTLDGDEFYKVFKPLFDAGVHPLDYSFKIFNRWGELIFETSDFEQGWDGIYEGKMVESGAFTWKIEFKLVNNDDLKVYTGHFNVLR